MKQPESDQLYYIAQNFYEKGYFDPTVKAILDSEDMCDGDIPKLLKYIDQCSSIIRNAEDELTIREMKKRIGSLIGQQLSDSYNSTISRTDLFKIYNFVLMATASGNEKA